MLRFDVSTRIAVVYAVAGCAWIVASDWVVGRVFADPAAVARAQTLKGWLFVGLSSLLVYALIRIHLERRERERRRAQRLRADLEEAQRIAGVGHWSLNVESGHLHWSDEVYRIFGVTPEEMDHSYEGFASFVHEEDRARMEAAQEAALEGREPLDVTHRIVRPDGEVRWVRERGELGRNGEAAELQLIGTVQDVTEPTLAERKLRESEARLKALSAHLQEAREEERRRISMDIHDQVGGTLAGVRMTLGRLIDETPEAAEPLRALALEIQEGLDQTITTVRDLSREMHPGILDELGLAASVEWLGGDFERRFDGDVQVEIRGEERIDMAPSRSIHLFRIAQEALTNVARHADAGRVRVLLAGEPEGVRLEVEDDGRGFRPERGEENMGLLNMRERATLLGGRLEIDSEPGRGTRVATWTPHGVTESGSRGDTP